MPHPSPRFRLWPRGRAGWMRAVLVLVAPLVVAALFVRCATSMPGDSHEGALPDADAKLRILAQHLEEHVHALAVEIGERNIMARPDELEDAAVYIEGQLGRLGYQVESQRFEVSGVTVRNLEVEIKGAKRPEEIVVVGAHYDSAHDTPAANDNGSGVAALIELARAFVGKKPARTLRLVAFVNEEPPYFQTDDMGAVRYARRCRERDEDVVAMLSLETIGYYSDEPGSQKYPALLSALYPDTGNFIGFVGNTGSRGLVRRCVELFRESAEFPCEGAALPGALPGIGWSDHWAFWQEGYDALMITDTALFRYPHYHEPTDTIDKIDFPRTALVVQGVERVVAKLLE